MRLHGRPAARFRPIHWTLQVTHALRVTSVWHWIPGASVVPQLWPVWAHNKGSLRSVPAWHGLMHAGARLICHLRQASAQMATHTTASAQSGIPPTAALVALVLGRDLAVVVVAPLIIPGAGARRQAASLWLAKARPCLRAGVRARSAVVRPSL